MCACVHACESESRVRACVGEWKLARATTAVTSFVHSSFTLPTAITARCSPLTVIKEWLA